MTIWWLILILATFGSVGLAFVWIIVRMSNASATEPNKKIVGSLGEMTNEGVEHIFDKEFREELRNRGRLHFEKIINENAMFLQQDLRLTTTELNEYMKSEITKKLTEEFNNYEQAIMDAKQLAIAAIQKTNVVIDEQRREINQQLEQAVIAQKQQQLQHFETNMADIVNHYILAAIGDQIDLNDQLQYILGDLEANKQAIVEDIKSGA